MDKNLALFTQINSLSYWLLQESNFKSSVSLDATDDSFFISIKDGLESIYKHHIEDFSKKDQRFLRIELSSIVSHLLQIKRSVKSHKHAS
ncbi:hypothetical protein DFQ05_0831 [Winogradskyella wandonensis]|uniref:Uncharacterized protein n=1 Tax=Winogradskyella wandonensis TaxID=1442586 RepID=A0A4R1KXJ5_9FLAO|nr:hypothetical protein [Winogradskyella wandonensis]TCK69310.1 hypothetical protein DFQ05_0831 [Winogradskyella wandonensis]